MQKALEKLGGLESGTASFAHGHGGESAPNFTSGAGLAVGRAGEMAGKIWKLGHAEKNNWDMGTLSRMIAGHKEKTG